MFSDEFKEKSRGVINSPVARFLLSAFGVVGIVIGITTYLWPAGNASRMQSLRSALETIYFLTGPGILIAAVYGLRSLAIS